jgi:hypothetical protein
MYLHSQSGTAHKVGNDYFMSSFITVLFAWKFALPMIYTTVSVKFNRHTSNQKTKDNVEKNMLETRPALIVWQWNDL